jgi:hypothetical protein
MKNTKKVLFTVLAALLIAIAPQMKAGGPGTLDKQATAPTEVAAKVNCHVPLTDEQLIEKARRFDRECLQDAQKPNTIIRAVVSSVQKCANGGEMRVVIFTQGPDCHGAPCPFFPIKISEVDFNCNDQVTAIKCFVKED